MIRKIIEIDRAKCNGCGACAEACHEGAIGMTDGKAELLRDDYCDGLGNCLPACPTGAISFVEREAEAYNAAAVENKRLAQKPLPCGCSGAHAKALRRVKPAAVAADAAAMNGDTHSVLLQWPVQIKLVPANAPYFENAKLLLAADCSAFACGDFHARFMKDRITLIGCPKLDNVDYSEKLTAILQQNRIRSIAVVRMEVPCCGGLELAVKKALQNSGKIIPWHVVILSTDGKILEQE